jgi:hypothetical protein
VLDTPLDILGTPCAELDVTTDTFSGLVAVRLCDVWPDGASTLISFGVLNLAQRDGRDAPLPVTPGSPYRVRVRLNDTGYRVAIGHRLRLGVSTSYWPIAWPTPEPLRLTLDSRTSHLDLPLLDKAANELVGMPFEPPRTPPPLAMTTLAPGRQERTITHDVETDEFIFSTVKDAGRTLLHHNKIEMASSTTERYSIVDNDPLTARARYTCDYAVGRGDWQTRTHGAATITCSRDSFFVQASLSAFEGDNEVSTRSWDLEIPRDGF